MCERVFLRWAGGEVHGVASEVASNGVLYDMGRQVVYVEEDHSDEEAEWIEAMHGIVQTCGTKLFNIQCLEKLFAARDVRMYENLNMSASCLPLAVLWPFLHSVTQTSTGDLSLWVLRPLTASSCALPLCMTTP